MACDMRIWSSLTVFLACSQLNAANEEGFHWLGVEFCKDTLGELLERYPDAEYFEEYELLIVADSGEILRIDVGDGGIRLGLGGGTLANINRPDINANKERLYIDTAFKNGAALLLASQSP